MRKHIWVPALLLLLCLTAVTVSAVFLNRQEEQVTYEVTGQQGDVQAAADFRVETEFQLRHRARWQGSFGFPDAPDSSFTYSRHFRNLGEESYYSHVEMGSDIRSMESTEWKTIESRWKENGLELHPFLRSCRDLQQSTPEGEVGQKKILLEDYFDFYPMSCWISTPEVNDSLSLYDWAYRYSPAKWQKFNDYFKIPIYPGDSLLLVSDKSYGHTAEAFSQEEARGEDFWASNNAVGASDGNACYFTFDAHTTGGNLVDTSLIPGGYGIYSVALGEKRVDFDSLTTVVSLDPHYIPDRMVLDETTGNILFFAWKEDKMYLVVVDPAKKEVLQELPLQADEEETYRWFCVEKGTVFAVAEGMYIDVFLQNGDGTYGHALHTPFPDFEDAEFAYSHGELSLAYQNGKVAAVGNLFKSLEFEDENGRVYKTNRPVYGFDISVLDESGVLYQGTYTASLEPKLKSEDDAYAPYRVILDVNPA